MARRFVLAFLLLATLFAGTTSSYFDYYRLDLVWPGRYCSDPRYRCCKPTTGYPAKDFFVSSFATYSETTNEPVTHCTNASFNVNELSGLKNELTAYWSSIRCPSNDGSSLWRSAWEKYGVCTGPSVETYFRAALGARSFVNVLDILAERGIKPAANVLYNLTEVRDAIKEKLGVNPAIQCGKSSYGIEGLFQISQIFLCFQPSGEIMECPVSPQYTCSSFVLFMPFEYSMLKLSSANALDRSNPITMPVSLH